MISPQVVNLVTEYLDQCVAQGSTATLVGVHWYVDAKNKTPPLLKEINEALKLRPLLRVERLAEGVIFSAAGKEQMITAEDQHRADKQYRKEFSVAYKTLQGKA